MLTLKKLNLNTEIKDRGILSQGFTLVEVLVAMAVSTVLLLAISSIIIFSAQNVHSIEKKIAYTELLSTLQQVVGKATLCTSSFVGQTLANGQPVKFTFGPTTWEDPALGTANIFENSITITKLQFSNVTMVTATTGTASLALEADLRTVPNEVIIGGYTRTAPPINVSFTVGAGNAIVSCGSTLKAYIKQDPVPNMGTHALFCNNPNDVALTGGCQHSSGWPLPPTVVPVDAVGNPTNGASPNGMSFAIQYANTFTFCWISCQAP